MLINIKTLPHAHDLELPAYATPNSAGMDLRAAICEDVEVKFGDRVLIPTGISIALPVGYEAQIRPRSGLAFKNGITVLNAPGTVDSDYRGEIKVLLLNCSNQDFVVKRGMRIAQLIIHKFETVEWNLVDELDDTSRSTGGYGSTGVN